MSCFLFQNIMSSLEEDLKAFHEQADEIRKLYPKLEKHSDMWVFGLYESICEEQLIHEFITQMIDIDKTIFQLCDKYKYNFEDYKIIDNMIYIKFFKNNFDDINTINNFMDSFGWFPALINNVKY